MKAFRKGGFSVLPGKLFRMEKSTEFRKVRHQMALYGSPLTVSFLRFRPMATDDNCQIFFQAEAWQEGYAVGHPPD